MATLTSDMILVMAVIAVAVFLFIVEWIRIDVVAILIMVALPLLGLVTAAEAFSGLSSNAVVSIIAVIIVGAGLDKTGVVNQLVAPVLKVAGNSSSRIVIAIATTVAFISSFMQNIGAAALFLPAVQRISKKLSIPMSQLLMPIGFSAILGGTLTLVGSSPLILLNDLMGQFKLEPFGLFDVTPIGAALVAGGIAIFVFFGRWILPKVTPPASAKDEEQQSTVPEGEVFELRTPEDFSHYRDPMTVSDLRQRYQVTVVAMVEPPDFKVLSPAADHEILSGVSMGVLGERKRVEEMAREEGLELKQNLEVFHKELTDQESGVVQAVISPRSTLVGSTLAASEFEERFQVSPVSLQRHDKIIRSNLGTTPLRVGDVLTLHGSWQRLHYLHVGEDGLLFTTPVVLSEMKTEKALFAAGWLIVALAMVMVFKINLAVCLMTGALGMILTRVLSIDEAYKAVDWRTVFLLAGLIPLGMATEKTGTAAWIANAILSGIGGAPPVVLILVIGLLSTFFTLVISNVGATVLLVPLAVNMALSAGIDPRMAALTVGLATSNSFILPTHQVNALYMGPGGYRSKDFMKAGSVMSICFLLIMVGTMYLYGL